MSKRKQSTPRFSSKQSRVDPTAKKHTLDSDEEDFQDDNNVLDENDIEGEEDGVAGQDGEQRMTAFNMKEELEEGHFDRNGHFIWNNEKEVRDNWLDNIDWQRVKKDGTDSTSKKYDIDESGVNDPSDSSDDEAMEEETFSELETYKQILTYLKPGESVNKALKRLGGDLSKLSSVERLKRKKAGSLTVSEDVTKLTELANKVLTRSGNMDVYQETYEMIQLKIGPNKNDKEPELDMYADDFDVKEKEKKKQLNDESEKKPLTLQWEYKVSATDEKIEGPISTAQMIKWQKENHFKPGMMVRKCGETTNFYSLGRIDFELYE